MIATALCFGVGLIFAYVGRDRLSTLYVFMFVNPKKEPGEKTGLKRRKESDEVYMDAISIATGVFFAIQWDGESADIELKPAD